MSEVIVGIVSAIIGGVVTFIVIRFITSATRTDIMTEVKCKETRGACYAGVKEDMVRIGEDIKTIYGRQAEIRKDYPEKFLLKTDYKEDLANTWKKLDEIQKQLSAISVSLGRLNGTQKQ